jgi:thioredoxin 1
MAVKNGVEEISEKQFDEFVQKDLVLVDFFAGWCMPCLIMAPIIEELAEKFKKIKFAKVNVDENSSLAQKLGIMSIPTLVIFNGGKEVERITKTMPAEQLEEKLKNLKQSKNL